MLPRAPIPTLQTSTALAVLAIGAATPALAQTQLWFTRFGSPLYDSPLDMVEAPGGGVYVAGITEGVMPGFPGGGLPGQDWLARYDAHGAPQWLIPIEHSDPLLSIWGRGYPMLAPDGSGGVYVTTQTWPLETTARYAPDGSRLWVVSSYEQPHGIVPIGGGSGGFYLLGHEPTADGNDIWVSRHDPDGQAAWTRTLAYPGRQDITSWSWAPDNADGLVFSALTTDPIVSPVVWTNDAWTARLDPAGALLWITQSQRNEWELRVGAEWLGDGYIQGGFTGVEDVAWVARFNDVGQQVWRTEIDAPADQDSMLDVLALPDGGLVAVGWQSRGRDPNFTNEHTAWLTRLDPGGAVLWRRQVHPPNVHVAFRLASDAAGGIYLTGWIGLPIGAPQPTGAFDVFLTRYSLCLPDLTTSAQIWHPGYGVPDGLVTNDDFFYYLARFTDGNPIADLTTGALPGARLYGTPDGTITNDDFFYYLSFFARGC